MQTNIFDHLNYRSYLLSRIGAAGTRTGLRKKAATAIHCHSTFLSQVLNSRAELSLEQAEAMNQFLQHTDEEAEYFLLLVESARSGTKDLERRIKKRINMIRDERHQIASRIPANKTIPESVRDEYYRTWLHGAVHTLVSIPQFQNLHALVQALEVKTSRVQASLQFLLKNGFITEHSGRLHTTPLNIHLKQGEPQTQQHHRNWRTKTLEAIENAKPQDLHYSGVISLSEKDAEVLRERFLDFLAKNVELIQASKPETALVMAFDLFSVN